MSRNSTDLTDISEPTKSRSAIEEGILIQEFSVGSPLSCSSPDLFGLF